MEEKNRNEELKKGVYLCHTGNKYRVLASALDSADSNREIVVYQSLVDGQIWVREKGEFLGYKEKDGQSKKRFEFLEEDNEGDEADWEGKYKRALADYQNLLKQQARERSDFLKYALSDFLQDILPVYDHLKLSLSSLSEEESGSAWVQGVRHVLKQFKDLLESKGVAEIETVGKVFDHDTMEAVDGEGGAVEREVMPGYTLHGRVIRPAKVIVGPASPDNRDGEEKLENNKD